jgi:hypothetical protein
MLTHAYTRAGTRVHSRAHTAAATQDAPSLEDVKMLPPSPCEPTTATHRVLSPDNATPVQSRAPAEVSELQVRPPSVLRKHQAVTHAETHDARPKTRKKKKSKDALCPEAARASGGGAAKKGEDLRQRGPKPPKPERA